VGHGQGEVTGQVSAPGCMKRDDYNLNPNTFFAQTAEQLLRIRVQRGGNLEVGSDGLAVLVSDATQVEQELLGKELEVGGNAPSAIDMTFYLNQSCPPERDKTPFELSAVSGIIRFDEIYAPQVSKKQVQIKATFTDVRFEDPRNDQRWAELSGFFDFLYVRGSPAQRFP
jgi:hypothetical protein